MHPYAEKEVAGEWRDLIGPEKYIALDSPAMAHMAPVKVELGQRRTPEERNKVPATLSLQTQCSQKSDDVENAAIAPVHSEPRFSPGDLHQTVDRAGKCRHT